MVWGTQLDQFLRRLAPAYKCISDVRVSLYFQWKPGSKRISLLQLAIRTHVFLVDLAALGSGCGTRHPQPDHPDTQREAFQSTHHHNFHNMIVTTLAIKFAFMLWYSSLGIAAANQTC